MEISEKEMLTICATEIQNLRDENSQLRQENKKLEKESETFASIAGVLITFILAFMLFGVPFIAMAMMGR